jgi:hypothetical protein
MFPVSQSPVKLRVPDGIVAPDVTTGDAEEVAADVPYVFVAVTRTRRVAPASIDVSVNVVPVAPAMSPQLLPAESQRRHWYEYAIGVVPLQLPAVAVNEEATTALPPIDGAEVFVGGVPGVGVGAGVGVGVGAPRSVGRGPTTAASAEALEADPNLLVAVTTTLSRYVTSEVVSA